MVPTPHFPGGVSKAPGFTLHLSSKGFINKGMNTENKAPTASTTAPAKAQPGKPPGKRQILLIILLFIAILVFMEHIITKIIFPPQLFIFKHDANYPPVGAIYVGLIAAALMFFFAFVSDMLVARKLRGWKKAAAVVCIVFLFFGVLEASLMKYISFWPLRYRPHPYMLFELKPPWRGKTSENINSEHMRYREFPARKEKGEYRFILLGDSTANGLGVRDGYRFGDVLEQKLQSTCKDRVIRVINAAVQAYSTAQVRMLYQQRIRKYSPDCVIIAVNNDISKAEVRDDDKMMPATMTGLFNLLYSFETYLLIRKMILSPESQRQVRRQPHYVTWRVPESDLRRHYAYIIGDMHKKGREVIMVSLPQSGPLLGDPDNLKFREILKDIALQNNCIFVDIFNPWKQDPARSKLFLDPCHPDETGHRLIGELLYRVIMEKNVVK